MSFFFFFFNDTATTEIYTLSLHDALPIYHIRPSATRSIASPGVMGVPAQLPRAIWLHPAKPISSAIGEKARRERSEEHTSELQSLAYLVCRLLLEKKKKTSTPHMLQSSSA